MGTLKQLMQLTETDRELYWLISRHAYKNLYREVKSNFCTSLSDIPHDPQSRLSLEQDGNTTVEIRAVELSCLSLESPDSAQQGSWCRLNILMEFAAPFRNGIVDIVIRNAVQAVAYRDSFPIDQSAHQDLSEAEFSWRFLCNLGEGLYDCDFVVKLFHDNGLDHHDVHFRSAYQFTVVSRRGSTAAGCCYLVPQFHAASRLGPPDLAGAIEFAERNFVALPDELMLIPVTAVNCGKHPWPVSGINRVNFSYWLQGPEIHQTHESAPRQPLTTEVAAGSRIDVDLVIKAPKIAGRYSINVGLVQERVAWLFLSESPIILDVVDTPPGSTPIA